MGEPHLLQKRAPAGLDEPHWVQKLPAAAWGSVSDGVTACPVD